MSRGAAYSKRRNLTGKQAGSTMGPSGTVDFDDLARRAGQGLFVDQDFPADDTSIYTDGQRSGFGAIKTVHTVRWLRPHEFEGATQPELFYDDEDDDTGDAGAEANDILQGRLGDCYFLSALAILCTSKGLGLIEKLFVEMRYFHKGLVGVKFFKNGMWWDVAVDTFVPTTDSRKPVFASNKDPNEFWMSMMEKAYAKMHGCYEAIDAGSMEDALLDLTAAAPGSITIKELFCAVQDAKGAFDKERALKLLSERSFGTLLQGAVLDGGDETFLPNGLVSGHAYSINKVQRTSKGDVLVRLRNPHGRGEWKGKWCDSDPAWTDALKREMGQSDRDDGMFWMSVDDFTKEFTSITFCDIVPRSFSVLRAETAWTSTTAGGMGTHWKANPQLLMRVSQKCHITISLNQPDTRMQFSPLHTDQPLSKDDFYNLWGDGSRVGYDHAMIFMIFKGSERKTGMRNLYAKSAYSAVRTLTLTLSDVEPGDYIIVPSLEDAGVQMKARMRFWSSAPVELIDTKGGKDWQVFDASDDAIGGQSQPLPQPNVKLPVEKPCDNQFKPEENMHVKRDPHHLKQSGVLDTVKSMAAMASWKIGDYAPTKWENGKDYFMGASSQFSAGEICCVMRPDKSLRFAKVERDCGNGCYDIMTAVTEWGFMYKFGVPSRFICKLPYDGHAPAALIWQVGEVFDLLDTNGNGTLDMEWNHESGVTGEMMTDVGKRLLTDMDIDTEDIPKLIVHMKQLDRNGDGVIDREEFVDWMSSRKMKLATSEHHVGFGIE